MNWIQKQRPNSILGLTLDSGRLEAVVLRRTNGSAEVQKSVTAGLTLDLLHNEAELVGREIRNQLDAAGVREKRCVVGVPLHWALTLHTKLPPLEPADLPSFLEIEAERGFPCSPAELQVASACHRSPGGDAYMTQIGVPRGHLARLEAALEAAGLKPVSLSPGIAALPEALPENGAGVITAVVGEASVEILVACQGGLVALRTLEGAFDTEGTEKRIQSELVARELRVTLGQLPSDIHESIRQLNIIGPGHFARALAEEIQPRAKVLGLEVRQLATCSGPHHGLKLPADFPVSPALSLAAQFLGRQVRGLEFLPPKPTLFQQLSSRYSSRRLVWAGATAGAAVLLGLGLFLYQQLQLSTLRADWAAMKPKVTELDGLQAQIRKYRPWYDESLTSLSILRRVTEAFPEDGAVSAKTIEIRNLSAVNCTGVARDNPALLKTLDRLRATRQVNEVRVDQIRGKAPLQFTFNFQWGEAPRQ